ncbi:MAG: flagellar motor protein [Deltaproteobacteria bacterium]|nr:MAG: flagellar motor protein [Deltaproteobacteria bacterium]
MHFHAKIVIQNSLFLDRIHNMAIEKEKPEKKSDETDEEHFFSPEPEDEPEVEGGGGGGEWIMTYADLVTLLFAFFVLLFAMSSTQQEAFKELVQSLKSALGVQQTPEAGTREGLIMPEVPPEERKEKNDKESIGELSAMVQEEIDDIASEVRELIMVNRLGGKVRVIVDERGTIIMISDILLFPVGKATMTDQGRKIIKKIYEILAKFSYPVKISGHTDNVPIHTEKHASNWELSTNRACEVVRLLIDEGIDPRSLSAEGYGEYRPVATNNTAEGRAQNRRVEIIYERQVIAEKLEENIY